MEGNTTPSAGAANTTVPEPATVTFNPTMFQVLPETAPSDVAVDDATVGEEPEDIDPAEWLSGSAEDDFAPEHVLLKNGKRILMAALTDSEELKVREMSKRKDKASGRVGLNMNFYKRNFIATSINKAYHRGIGMPGFIIGDQLAQRPTGELNELLKAAFRISGMELGDTPSSNTDTNLLFN